MQIFVSNLAWATTEDELRQLFEPYGIVESVRIITDRDTGRARLWLCRDAPYRRGTRRD
jgi:RNA recognition motif-containing protein